eukprot:1968825-Lingulodinium_polyedra.AAC.1
MLGRAPAAGGEPTQSRQDASTLPPGRSRTSPAPGRAALGTQVGSCGCGKKGRCGMLAGPGHASLWRGSFPAW